MLKRYYSIQEAVEFLTFEIKQNLSAKDIVESAIRGEIRFCIWFDGGLAKFKYTEEFPFSSLDDGPYLFRGYIKIPRSEIEPERELVCFDPNEIHEILFTYDDYQFPEIESPYFYSPYDYNHEKKEYERAFYQVNYNDAVIPSEDILALISTNQRKVVAQIISVNQHKSKMLVILNQAFNKFWTNVDKNDPTTYPKKITVVAWLQKNGFSQSLAEKGATIIRPEWVPAGRRPEE
ncbi:hypothetical protein Nit79A3_3368 [Nitrosomonas sp. Is79A3]|uniref:hypothetical protein n=1 Tax=Nitrosomonas sp. (strain Is79A3) TaxID=261292 RepID=UPI000215D23C